jgi:hypothetical protein
MRRILIILLAVAAAIAPLPPDLVQRAYSASFYMEVQRRLTAATNVVPFALLDVGLAALLLWVILRAYRRLGRSPAGHARAAGAFVMDLAATASLVYLMFLVVWGLNYRRAPVTERLDFSRARVTPDAVERLARDLVDRLNAGYAAAHARPWPEIHELTDRMSAAFERAQGALGMPLPTVPGRPKRTLLSAYFRRSAIDGLTDPFFLEVLVNDGVLAFERPSIVAHEWGHLAGFADEAEAGLVSWMTTERGDAQMAYSGRLALFGHTVPSLEPAARGRVSARLADGPRRDLNAIATRLAAARPAVRAVAEAVYDRFLRVQGVESGVASYDDVVTLVVGTRFDRNARPPQRP